MTAPSRPRRRLDPFLVFAAILAVIGLVIFILSSVPRSRPVPEPSRHTGLVAAHRPAAGTAVWL